MAGGSRLIVVRQQEARFQQNLKTVADAQHQFAGVTKVLKRLDQVVANLAGDDASGGDVVAVAEAAGQAQNLVRIGLMRVAPAVG